MPRSGRFDPTLLENDSYILQLSATDAGGNVSSTQRQVNLDGQLKLGNFQLSFVDLSIPVAGIPITVSRTYDTLQADTSDDLGFGWSLGLFDTNLRTDVPPSGLEASDIYNPFRIGSKVYITNPSSGRREGFTFTAESPSRFAIFGNVRPRFIPDPGVTSTLSVQPIDLAVTDTGELVSFVGSLPYNPASGLFGGFYTLTSKEGIRYRVDGNTGDVESITDRNGNVLSFNEAGISSSTGEAITFERDPQGRITAVIDPAGNRIGYEYNAMGDLVSVTDREGNSTKYVYDAEQDHYIVDILDPLGREAIKNEYDEDGRLTKIFDPTGTLIDFSYDPSNLVEVSRRALDDQGTQATTIIERDPKGNEIRQVNADGGEVIRTFDINGNLLSESDPLGRTTEFTFDANNNLLSETDPTGSTTVFTYDSFGDLLSRTDSLGNTTRNYYQDGNLISSRDPEGRLSSYTYNPQGNLTDVSTFTNFTSFSRSYTYDSRGRQIAETDSLGTSAHHILDPLGRTIETRIETIENGSVVPHTTRSEYDRNDNVIRSVDPEGNTIISEYDEAGNLIASIDALGRKTILAYDARGNNTSIVYPDGSTEFFAYDLGGRLTAQTDTAGRSTYYRYDNMDRLVAVVLPDSTPIDLTNNPQISQTYDQAGQLVRTIDPLGSQTDYEYDGAGRRSAIIDSSGNSTATTYDSTGRIASFTNQLGRTTNYRYDSLGRTTSTINADGTSTNTSYPGDNSQVITDENGNSTTYTYYSEGRLVEVSDALNNTTRYTYDQLGRIIQEVDGNGNSTVYEYDKTGRLIAKSLPEGQRVAMTYDGAGNLIAETNALGETTRYEYDLRDRLVEQILPDGGNSKLQPN